jgi:hypothetical protein
MSTEVPEAMVLVGHPLEDRAYAGVCMVDPPT